MLDGTGFERVCVQLRLVTAALHWRPVANIDIVYAGAVCHFCIMCLPSARCSHFYTKKYTQRLLSQVAAVNAKYPWEKRQPILFGRFSNYFRHVHPAVNATSRSEACAVCNPTRMPCSGTAGLYRMPRCSGSALHAFASS